MTRRSFSSRGLLNGVLTVSERSTVRSSGVANAPRLRIPPRGGPHRCIGEALARAELEESLAVLIARIPQLRLDQPPAIKGHAGIRRVEAMRVSWRV
jgi:cytochrome P450